MAIKYRMYQNKRKSGKNAGHWYARAVVTNHVRTKELSERISERCTVTEADIVAVVSALVKEMTYELKNGSRVTLDGFGSFKVGICSRGVADSKDFSPVKHIHSPHVLFQPETKIGADRTRLKTFISGIKVKEMALYNGGEALEQGGGSASGSENP